MFLEASATEGSLYRIAQEVNEQSLSAEKERGVAEFSAMLPGVKMG